MERTFHGKTWKEMSEILSILCDLEDRVEMKKEEESAFDIALICVAAIANRMINNAPIDWD